MVTFETKKEKVTKTLTFKTLDYKRLGKGSPPVTFPPVFSCGLILAIHFS